MAIVLPNGRFTLKPGIRLIPDERGGVVLQQSPLRAIRVNKAALGILLRCKKRLDREEGGTAAAIHDTGPVLSFLDSFYLMGLVQWEPSQETFEPFVSIIIPVYNRAHEIAECLQSLLQLNYPSSKREIIVIDDGSSDDTAAVVRQFETRLILEEKNRGQSAARNTGMKAARGEILAFIDSDCQAEPDWLKELVPYFSDPRVALVGGFVASQFQESWLDRYEEVKSPLNMGSATAICAENSSDFYVPTCNMLVRKEAYEAAGGLDEAWRVGEDVDLCWKLKKLGRRLIYVSKGKVRHKHRNQFWGSFKRRFDYGTSEPALYARHGEVSKRFPWQPYGLLFFSFCSLALLAVPWFFGSLALATLVSETLTKKKEINEKTSFALSFLDIFCGIAKNHFTLVYYLSFYCVRYHLLLAFIAMLLLNSTAPLLLSLLLLPALADFIYLKPRISFPVFSLFYFTEHLFYQAGVLWGSLNNWNFRCYRLFFVAAKRSRHRTEPPRSALRDNVGGKPAGKAYLRQH